jgi:hypothetical protein
MLMEFGSEERGRMAIGNSLVISLYKKETWTKCGQDGLLARWMWDFLGIRPSAKLGHRNLVSFAHTWEGNFRQRVFTIIDGLISGEKVLWLIRYCRGCDTKPTIASLDG